MTTDTGRALAVLLLAATLAAAQPPDAATLRGESAQTRKRLAEAEAKAAGDKPGDAVDDLQRVLDDAGDDLIGVDAKHFRPARWVAHQVFTKLRGDALKPYQDRIDEPARKLLAAGKRDRDPRPLWALLDQYFVSRPAEEGILLLGDLHFERGDFRTAELLWRRLLPGGDVPFPSPKADPAAVWAKVILAVIFQGEHDRAKAELTALHAKHPAATGLFAGKDGPLSGTLQALLETPPRPALEAANRSWATVGGGPERTGRVGGRLPIHWPSRPTWTMPLAGSTKSIPHPVIADGRVFVSAGNVIATFDLLTGRESAVTMPDLPAFGPASAADGKLYARLGSSAVRDPKNDNGDSAIACYGPPLLPRPNRPPLTELWRVKPPTSDQKVPSVWEGAPLVSGRRMWAALARFEGGRVTNAVACFDPADADRAPDRSAWVADVSDSPLSLDADGRARQELLTLAGRNVVFCTHTGAVVALDGVSGRKAWAFRYPRSPKRAGDAGRTADPAPAVAFGGRVFVAPADADRVYALDAETGQPLWESVQMDGAQLLGVSRGRVIVTVSGQLRGIRALSVVNGSQREPDGWVQHDGGGLATAGRGVVTDDVIAWPTKAGLFFLRSDDGQPMCDPLRATQSALMGNVACADGCLVVATATQVLGFVSEEKRFAARGDVSDVHGKLTVRTDHAEGQLRDATLIASHGELVSLNEWMRRSTKQEPQAGSRPSAPNFVIEEAPSLTADADIDHTVLLPPGSQPLQPIRGASPPKHLFAVAGSDLLRVTLKGGLLPALRGDEPLTHAADFPGGFVAAGPLSVAVYAAGPQPVWVFRVPTTEPLPLRPDFIPIRTDEPPAVPQMSSFVLAGSWLFARLGEHHLVALDMTAKRVAWVLGAHGRARFEPVVFPSCPRFEPHFFISEHVLIPQLSDGRRWAVRAETGRVTNEVGSTFSRHVPHGFGEPTAQAAWPHPPVDLGEGRVAFADGPGTVRNSDPHTGRAKWKYVAADEHSLTGEPPQVRAWDEVVLVAIRRNHGVELDRVKPTTGVSAWTSPPFFDADRIDLSTADADPWRVYIPVGNTLNGVSLSKGTHVWEAELPDTNGAGGWVVRAGRRAVIAYPAVAIPAESPVQVWERFERSLLRQPFGWRLPAVAAGLYDAWVARTVPVLLFDPECGKLLKQIDVPARGPGVTAWVSGELAVVMTGDRVVWIR